LEGEATPGGSFSATLEASLLGVFLAGRGEVTFEFEDGSELTVNYSAAVNPQGREQGAWQVAGGTGQFAGAVGGGKLVAYDFV
jgi:hypothetical protein